METDTAEARVGVARAGDGALTWAMGVAGVLAAMAGALFLGSVGLVTLAGYGHFGYGRGVANTMMIVAVFAVAMLFVALLALAAALSAAALRREH